MRHKIKGIVIREYAKGETSKLLTILTPNLGVITVNAKGVRKLSSPYLKSAQMFAFSDMLLYEKNGYYTLTEASLIADFYTLSGDIKKYALACYLCEAGSAFAVAGEDSSAILRLVLNSLYALENDVAPISILKPAFELRLCGECGLAPDLSCCCDCGALLANSDVMFDLNEGVCFCPNCSGATADIKKLSPSVAKAIKHILESELSRFISFRIGEAEQHILSQCAEKYLLIHSERGFKTLSFYKHCDELP